MRGRMKGVILVLLLCVGCDALNDKPQAVTVPQPTVVQSYQRFVPLRFPNPGTNQVSNVDFALGYALDTETGQLCRTWDWSITGAKKDLLPDAAPTCGTLYLQSDNTRTIVDTTLRRYGIDPATATPVQRLMAKYGMDPRAETNKQQLHFVPAK